MKKPKIGVRVFTLPGEEMAVMDVFNNPDYVVVDEVKNALPKEGVILLYLKWEDYSEDVLF